MNVGVSMNLREVFMVVQATLQSVCPEIAEDDFFQSSRSPRAPNIRRVRVDVRDIFRQLGPSYVQRAY